MGKYGKWIGGGLGWVMAGPIGAILGFVFGSMYDSMQSGEYVLEGQTAEDTDYGRPHTRPGDFSMSLLVLTAAMMKADNSVKRSELNYVKQFFIRQFGPEQARQQLQVLRRILKQNIPVHDVAVQIRNNMDYSSRLQLMHFLFGIAGADNQVVSQEIQMLKTISGAMGVHNHDFESLKAMFVKEKDGAYKILEIQPGASLEQVKKAYRTMASKYHPDKVSHLGQDIQKAAKEKFQKINAAYQEILKERGVK